MNLKHWKYRILTIRKDLRGIFIIALISILVIDLWLINIPAFFPVLATLGEIYYKICLAYITGFIFYFLNVHLQSEKNKVKTYRYINNKCGNIDSLIICLIASMRLANGQSPRPNAGLNDEEELLTLCKGINPLNKFQLYIPYNRTFTNWSECMIFFSKEIKVVLQELLIVRDTINSELIGVLTDIDEYLDELNRLKGTALANKDIAVYFKSIYGLCNSSNELFKVLRTKYYYHQKEYQSNYKKNANK